MLYILCMCTQLLQSCPTVCDPMDYSPPGPLSMGFLLARILEWLAMPSFRGSSWPRGRTCISHISCSTGRFFTTNATWEALYVLWVLTRIARKNKKTSLSDQCKEIEENNGMGKTRDLFKRIRDTKGTFHAKISTIKDRNGMALIEAEDIKKRWQQYMKNYTKKIFMTQITTMVWSLT